MEQERYLSKLPCANSAAFNTSSRQHDPRCLPGTRADPIQQMNAWAYDAGDECIFWLSGMAGTGKSTIARTVAHDFYRQKCLGASFFFSRDEDDLSKASKFFSTIACQLAAFSPALKGSICKAIQSDPEIGNKSMVDQWNQLIFQPLSVLGGSPETFSTIMIVIDALHECGGPKVKEDIDLILQLLVEAKNLANVRLRVYITSRPDDHICDSFKHISLEVYRHFALYDVAKSIVDNDISALFRHKFEDLRKERRGLHDNWLGEENIKLLTQRADGLFIYAATASLYIKGSRREKTKPKDRFLQVLQGKGFDNLDKMYTQILLQSVIDGEDRKNNDLHSEIKRVLRVIVTSFELVSAKVLRELCSTIDLETVWIRLESLQSVLVVPESEDAPIRILHPSFRDFLLDKGRCSDNHFWIDDKDAHRDIFNSSMGLMSSDPPTGLRRDICGMHQPDTEVGKIESSKLDSYLPLHTQYACRYWVDHLAQLQTSQREEAGLCDNGQVYQFLQVHLLHWLEALAWIGKTSEGILAILSLEAQIQVSLLCGIFLRRDLD